MRSDAEVLIIGGGIAGASVLYWLTRLGMSDVILVERRELTSGSTWHAAGNTTYFGPYAEMTSLFAGSIRSYLAAEEESGHSVGFHQTGSLRLATSPRERELFHSYEAKYEKLKIPYRVVENDEVQQLHPCLNLNEVYGAAHTPTDGHVDPSGATYALAKAAKKRGAEIQLRNPVESLVRDSGVWIVNTRSGPIRAKNIVIAASFWSRELLQPLGLNLPLYATEHHEFITETVPQLSERNTEVPAIRDSFVSFSMRQEQKGFLVGIYETDPVFWSLDGIPTDFAEELLPPNIDRLMTHMERLMDRVPAISEVGIKTINNGPMCWTPDGLPLLGPAVGHDGLWLATGFNVGIGTGGGSGEFLAHWMVDGKPPIDLPIVHPQRFGNNLSRDSVIASIRECYKRGYKLPEAI